MSKITARRSSVLPLLTALITPLALLIAFMVSLSYTSLVNAAGSLTVDIIAGYNLVVDSNVQAPSTAAPSVATVIGRVCNTGPSTVSDVSVSIGNYNGGTNSTPGIYPARVSTDASFISQHPSLANTGSYAFTHIGGTADATRIIPTLGASGTANSCAVEYWHFTYPRCANLSDGTPVSPPCTNGATWGDSVKPDDDLWLTFDVWAAGSDGSVATDTWKMTMRNEISAMANKIQPNPLGEWFNTESSKVQAGGLITTNGILYELGRINQGFDNDGDLAYDYNAWLQPIGDPSFDPTCFRLIRTTGVLTVSRGAGQSDSILNFTDQLYFTNLPPDNTGVRGLVFYTFMAIRGSCATAVSPYQEVASGADNEKFNGDYGAAPPPPSTTPPEVSLDKTGNITVTAGSRITYTVSLSNAGPNSAGNPSIGMPLVLSDTVPASTTFTGFTNASTTSITILYSTDHGKTYTTTQPVPPSTVTNVQWWLTDPLAAGANMAITFSVQVNPAFPPPGANPYINNCADVSFGGAMPFAQDCAPTLVSGNYNIGDRVWRDDSPMDSLQSTGELSISNISLYLYYDKNGDGALDSGDLQLLTTTTSVTGWYNFGGLITGTYLVLVDSHDRDLPQGYRNTTPITYATRLSSTRTSDLAADFGFGPSMDLTKTVSYDGQYVRYSIPVNNLRPGGGEVVGNYCRYTVWAGGLNSDFTGTGSKGWLNPQNAYIPPGPDGAYATGPFANSTEQLGLTSFNLGLARPGSILTVEVILPIQVYPTLAGSFHVALITPSTTVKNHSSHIFDAGALTSGQLITDVTHDRGGTWSWSDFNGNTLGVYLETFKAGNPGGHLDLDAVGFRITSNSPCVAGATSDVMTSIPLTDTYDTSRLQFVSAVPPQSGINTTTGVITWTNVGPISPGQSQGAQVTFLALEKNVPFTVTNSACVTGGTFIDGQLVNDKCVTVTKTFTPPSIITGVVWVDANSSGWYDSTGFEATEARIPGVSIELYGCYDNVADAFVTDATASKNKTCQAQSSNSGWVLVDTQVTNQAGAFTFTNLVDAYYYAKVITTTLPATATETAEATFQANGGGYSCAGTIEANNSCDNIWGNPDATLKDNANPANNIFNPIVGPEAIRNVNFGYNMLAVIYGTVWEDHDGDGIRDLGDDGFPISTSGITVTLTDSLGRITQTKTITNGYYKFTGLFAGTYTITVVTGTLPPPGGTWTQTADPDAALDNRHTVTIAAGELSGSWDFGYHRGGTYTIGDTVYTDWNGNGTQDSGEEGLSGITVTLYADSNGDGLFSVAQDAMITTTTTSVTGTYLFTGLFTGTYFVRADTANLPSWWDDYRETQDPDEAGVCSTCNNVGRAVVSSTHPSELNMDFGYQPVGFSTIGDYVWYDANRDGLQGATETGIPGVVVQLYEDSNGNGYIDPDDALVMTKTTNASGNYLFSNLLTNLQALTGTHGDYLVQVLTSTVTKDVNGSPYVLTTQSNPITVALSTGQNYLDADFGFAPGGRIGDRIWLDYNGNGNQDLSEPGISGVVVTLYNDVNGDRHYTAGTDTQVAVTTTITNGIYYFNGLPAGDYVVVVDTSTLVGLTQTGDPDIGLFNPCSIACDSQSGLHLAEGQQDLSRDFGYQPPLHIGDRVWLDTDRDGVQDSGEPGIPGVVITLTNSSVVTTTTDSDGYYVFGGLTGDHTYTVTVNSSTLPPSVQATYEYRNTVTPDGQVTVTLSSTDVTSISGLTCTGCAMDVDFGYAYAQASFTISGVTFHDINGNGGTYPHPEPITDTVYPNVLVYLWLQNTSGSFTLIDSMWTNSSGAYSFTNLYTGTYKVSTSPTAPNGETITTDNVHTPIGSSGIDLNTGHPSDPDNDFGFVGPGYPTLVKLASFTARARTGESPLIEWATSVELNNLGFNLYRTGSPNELPGPEQRLNEELIPSKSLGGLLGETYAYVDETAVAGITYYYWLEAIDTKGVRDVYGPVSTESGVDITPPSGTPGPIYLPIVIKQGQ
jgi:uncharacterized repeat protein (TIGR01451 family)